MQGILSLDKANYQINNDSYTAIDALPTSLLLALTREGTT